MCKFFFFSFFLFLLFTACTKSSSNGNDNTYDILYDGNPRFVSLVGSSPDNALDLLGGGKASISHSFIGSPFSPKNVTGSVLLGSGLGSSVNIVYNKSNFKTDTSLVVEFLDTAYNPCRSFYSSFAKDYNLPTYDQSTFVLPQIVSPQDPKNFSNYSEVSIYRDNFDFPCKPYYSYNLFSSGSYAIFRIRNRITNKSRYGWLTVTAYSDYNGTNLPSISEFAINNKEEEVLAPGYH